MNFTKGYTGDAIRIYQYWLGLVPDGVFGQKTMDATKRFQKSMNMPDTGVMYNSTLAMIDRMNGVDVPYIRTAKEYLHVREADVDGDGRGDNRGAEIDRMIRHVWSWYDLSDGGKAGIPWCAAFVCYILHKASNGKFAFKSASARETLEHARSRMSREIRKPSDLRRHEIAIGGWVTAKGTGHVYFIDPVSTLVLEPSNSGYFRTIEGNTDRDGSREGDGVYMKKRSLRTPAGTRAYAFRIDN
jgi:hypothetical protein